MPGLSGRSTRPDAALAVSKLASSMAKNPGATLPLVKHLMGYLFGSVELVLVYSHNMPMQGDPGSTSTVSGSGVLEVHTDAGFAPLASRSQEAAIVYQEGCPVSWLSLLPHTPQLSPSFSALLQDTTLAGRTSTWRVSSLDLRHV